MTEIKATASHASPIAEFRRFAATVLVGWAMKAAPKHDIPTLEAFENLYVTMLGAIMGVQSGPEKHPGSAFIADLNAIELLIPRARAVSKGAVDPIFDLIMDSEALLKGQKALMSGTPGEVAEKTRKWLEETLSKREGGAA